MSANSIVLTDGFKTIITLQNLPLIKLKEKEVNPPAITAGGPIDITTMRSTAWRTAAPKQLKTMGQITANCAYATEVIDQLIAQLQVNQIITVTFPDTSSIEFWGWLDSFTPSSNKEGEQPMASVVFVPSMTNADGVETAPVYNEPTES